MWQIRYGATVTSLAVTLAGDYNDNGVVDAADYVVWRKLKGTMLNPRADGDANGQVDTADYSVWRAQFGVIAGFSAAKDLSAVPEPVSKLVGPLLFAYVCTGRHRNYNPKRTRAKKSST
jgi:hypothetical protein